MLLSEAIRLGAMMKPQGRGTLLKDGKTCAMGAAMDAEGLIQGDRVLGKIPSWTMFMFRSAKCPACERCHQYMGPIIAMLNDNHGWTREQIADWVELQEIALGLAPQCATDSSKATNTNNNQNEKDKVIA